MKIESGKIIFNITEENQNTNLKKVSVGYKCNLSEEEYMKMRESIVGENSTLGTFLDLKSLLPGYIVKKKKKYFNTEDAFIRSMIIEGYTLKNR